MEKTSVKGIPGGFSAAQCWHFRVDDEEESSPAERHIRHAHTLPNSWLSRHCWHQYTPQNSETKSTFVSINLHLLPKNVLSCRYSNVKLTLPEMHAFRIFFFLCCEQYSLENEKRHITINSNPASDDPKIFLKPSCFVYKHPAYICELTLCCYLSHMPL